VDVARLVRCRWPRLRRPALLQRRRLRTLGPHRAIHSACEAAVGRRESIAVFGTDYPTPDGTGLRDYIHVEDLASAHLDALRYLREGGESTILNCGYGHGYSVREVLQAVERANGAALTIVEEPRRAGDPPELVAIADKVRNVLGWAPQFDNLDTIVETSLNWERKIAAADPSAYWPE